MAGEKDRQGAAYEVGRHPQHQGDVSAILGGYGAVDGGQAVPCIVLRLAVQAQLPDGSRHHLV